MKKTFRIIGLIAIYTVIAVLIVLSLVYLYKTSDFFRSLFEGNTATTAAPAKLATENDVREAAKTVQTMNRTAAHLSLFILIAILILQAFAFVTAGAVFVGLRHSTESIAVRMKKLDNADLFLDLPLYFGLLGTVASFIVMSFNPNISRLIAYSSTLVGIIFSVILRLTLQYPLKQALICAAAQENEAQKEVSAEEAPAPVPAKPAEPAADKKDKAPAADVPAKPADPAANKDKKDDSASPASDNSQKTPQGPKVVNVQMTPPSQDPANLQKTPPAQGPRTVNIQTTTPPAAPRTVSLQKTPPAQGQTPDAHSAENANQAQNERKEVKK